MKRAKTDRLQELKGLAGKQQYLLHDQIESFLDESASVEDMDEVYIALNDLKVDVFDSHEEAQQKLKLKRKEEKRPQEKQLLQHPMRYDDPVRMYLREMGRVPLLDREGEVEIAKRIKAGERQMCTALFRSNPISKELLTMGIKLKQSKMRVEDFLQIDFGNWNPEYSPKRERARALKAMERVRQLHVKLVKLQEKSVARASEEKRRAHTEKTRLAEEELLRDLYALNFNVRLIDRLAAVGPALGRPLVIYSRLDLNGMLLRRAQDAGAAIEKERVLGLERTSSGWQIRTRSGKLEADLGIGGKQAWTRHRREGNRHL